MIDRIEKNILDSEDYVKKGQVHLNKAQENQKKALKVSCRDMMSCVLERKDLACIIMLTCTYAQQVQG